MGFEPEFPMDAVRKCVTLMGTARRGLSRVLLPAISIAALACMVAQTPNIADLEHRAQAGDAKAQFDLAEAYFEGTGITKDLAKGLEWLRKSASQGFAGAEVTLGYLYQNGVQVPKDPHEAARWYRKAARQSDKDPKHAQKAQSDLGVMATNGLISVNEADWRAPEPGSDDTQPAKNPPVKTPEVKSSAPKGKAAPFSLAEVETGLTGGITPRRMATLVGQYGVDFSLNASARQRLSNDGADDSLLATIASSKR
jgi:hypothetical protein